MRRVRSLLSLALAALVIAGCAVGPTYQRPDPVLPGAFPEDSSLSGGQYIGLDWWKLYNDTQLSALIDAALSRNVDLALAAAQIQEAEAVVRETGAAVLPEIDVNGNSNRTASSTATALPSPAGIPSVRTDHRAVLSTSFELDLWGKLRGATEASRARLLATRYSRDTVRLTLASATAQNYFTLRSLDAQIAMTRTTLDTRDQTLRIVGDRVRAGYASDLDLSQARLARAPTPARSCASCCASVRWSSISCRRSPAVSTCAWRRSTSSTCRCPRCLRPACRQASSSVAPTSHRPSRTWCRRMRRSASRARRSIRRSR